MEALKLTSSTPGCNDNGFDSFPPVRVGWHVFRVAATLWWYIRRRRYGTVRWFVFQRQEGAGRDMRGIRCVVIVIDLLLRA